VHPVYSGKVSLYTLALRPALFSLDAERAHDLTMAALRQPLIARAFQLGHPASIDPRLRQQVFGLTFDHPVGLAAGLDKQGTAAAAWAALGFSSAEIGTVTPRPQPGNPRPRLFRLQQDVAIINRFGFNSDGAERVAENLRTGVPRGLTLGVNIGKNKDTPNDRAADDCVRVVDALHRFADYFVINVSSPNTQGLRDLQQSRALRALVEAVTARVREVARDSPVPVLIKVSPDAAPADLLESVDAAVQGGAAGIVATNTTVARSGLATPEPLSREAGGLSGSPLRPAANAICRMLFKHLGPQVPIVGVGGVFSADDAYERIRSGARLVQVYTALIYEGPAVVRRIVHGLAERLRRDGLSGVEEAVGADVR
jgi:dihydroorotate dehydrogenase